MTTAQPEFCCAVEERCAAIMQAAEEAASKLMHELKAKLLGMPKKVGSLAGP